MRPSAARRLVYLCLQHNRPGQASFTHVHEIIAGLRREGWHVDLFEPTYRGQSPGLAARLWASFVTQVRAARAVRQADAVYVRAHVLAAPLIAVARRRHVPVVVELNGIPSEAILVRPYLRAAGRLIQWLAHYQMRASTAVIAVTELLAQWAAAEGASDVVVIPNGANVDVFRPGGTPPAGLPDRYAVFFGAFAPWQGIAEIVAARAEPAWPDGVGLVFAGDGQERSIVEAATARFGDVVYVGTVPYQALAPIISGAVCGLSPQNDVGGRSGHGLSPLKLYETLACGVPVVVTDAPGQADLVREGGCGLVVPFDNATALADAVTRLAADPGEAVEMGRRGRTLVEEQHSWAARARTTDALLGEVLAATRGPRQRAWETTSA